jgi:hypothetical protein
MTMPVLLAAALAATTPATADTVSYTIRPSDTLWRLSTAFLVPEKTWHTLLPLSGTHNPRRLAIGRTIVVPRAWLRETVEPATLASFHGTVSIVVNGQPVPPSAGMTIEEGAEITTAANSFATLLLRDRSKVALPSLSHVRVRQLRRLLLTGVVDYHIDLLGGRVETQVTPLGDPSGRYRIGTPISMTAVRGTEYRVDYRPDASVAETEVLEGTVAVSDAQGGRTTLVPHDNGAWTTAAGETSTEALLPAPDLVDPGRIQKNDAVDFRIAPVPGAASYHVELAHDAGFIDTYAEKMAAGETVDFADVPDGIDFVRVSAISPNGIEGREQSYAFDRRLASIHGGEISREGEGYRFHWFGTGQGVRHYRFQLTPDGADATPIIDQVGLAGDDIKIHRLPHGVYYWRVCVIETSDKGEVSNWSRPEKLTIAAHDRGAIGG